MGLLIVDFAIHLSALSCAARRPPVQHWQQGRAEPSGRTRLQPTTRRHMENNRTQRTHRSGRINKLQLLEPLSCCFFCCFSFACPCALLFVGSAHSLPSLPLS